MTDMDTRRCADWTYQDTDDAMYNIRGFYRFFDRRAAVARRRLVLALIAIVAPLVAYLLFGDTVQGIAATMVSIAGGK